MNPFATGHERAGHEPPARFQQVKEESKKRKVQRGEGIARVEMKGEGYREVRGIVRSNHGKKSKTEPVR